MKKRTRKPTLPGEMLKEEFLIPMGITQREFANHIAMEVKAINRLVNGRCAITPIMALKLSAALGTTAEFWMNLQNNYDFWVLQNSKIPLPKKISRIN